MTTKNQSNNTSAEEPGSGPGRSGEEKPSKKRRLEKLVAGKGAPKYGEQAYWENRYKRQFQDKQQQLQGTGTEESEATGNGDNGVGTQAYHAWYFTYEELRPILMPLIVGGRNEIQEILRSAEADGEIGEESDDDNEVSRPSSIEERKNEENSSEADADKKRGANGDSKEFPAKLTESDGLQADIADPDEEEEAGEDQVGEEEAGEEDAGEEGNFEDYEEFEEVEEDEDCGEVEFDRGEGLASAGPIKILEIGCGDVPLGVGLANDFENLQKGTGAGAPNVVSMIHCVDYSETVIRAMEQQHCQRNGEAIPLTFSTTDARDMDFPDSSFQLIVEKGTLDAMLSDAEEGTTNCVKTVAECARILTSPGCLFIISHLNAHTSKGMDWLRNVVCEGIQSEHRRLIDSPKIVGTSASKPSVMSHDWIIEVHGNAEEYQEEDDLEKPSQGPGPAVYVIQKIACSEPSSTKSKDGSKARISVRFYSY